MGALRSWPAAMGATLVTTVLSTSGERRIDARE